MGVRGSPGRGGTRTDTATGEVGGSVYLCLSVSTVSVSICVYLCLAYLRSGSGALRSASARGGLEGTRIPITIYLRGCQYYNNIDLTAY